MKVSDINENYKISQLKKLKKTSKVSGDFSNLLVGDDVTATTSLSNSSETQAINSINPLNSINLISNFESSNSRQISIEYGKDLLSQLENLKKALILGVFEYNTLQSIEARLNNISINTEDAKLKNIIEEIKTRAIVEAEKLKKLKTK